VWGIWTLATVGGELRKIHDGGYGAVLSPDGSRIAFLSNRDIWLMRSNGEEPARMLPAAPGENLSDLNWSPDGRWLTYRRSIRQSGVRILEARIPGAADTAKIFESPDLEGFCWLSAGVIVLNLWEAPAQPTSNLWEIHMDPKRMQPAGKPLRLTNWAGFALGHDVLSASSDGRRLVIAKEADQSDVFMGEFADHGDTLRHVRRLTSNERVDWPGGWSSDSRWLLFQSDLTGRMSIFRASTQTDEPTNPETLVADEADNRAPILSPDGKWILYLSWRGGAGGPKSAKIMRIPPGGGSAEPILETQGSLGFLTSGHVVVPTTAGHPAFRCPTRPGASCVLSEVIGNDIVFSSFEPAPSAVRTEVFRLKAGDPTNVFWDLSPDGSRIAYGERGSHSLIRVREVRAETTREIPLPAWPDVYTVGWAADGTSLFATDFAPTGSSLLHISLDGKARVLYKGAKELELPKASPDGRYLAFGEVVSNSNVWLVENLPR
jgi:Tol biopolymer transport system component